MNSGFEWVDQQKDFVVVHKAPGVGFHQEEDALGLFQRVAKAIPDKQLFPVHRLDKVTSGLVLFATNQEAAAALGEQFEQKRIEKYYLAISDNKPVKKQGLIKGDMEKARRSAWKLCRSMHNPAITQFKSYSTGSRLRLFLVKPHTGKTHQIRVALKSISAPILGDALYGNVAEQETCDRTYLHAFGLRFTLGEQSYAYCQPPIDGVHFSNTAIKQLISDTLTPPWKIDFPRLDHIQRSL